MTLPIKKVTAHAVSCALAFTLVQLAGCGGSGGSGDAPAPVTEPHPSTGPIPTPPTPPAPPSTLQSTQAVKATLANAGNACSTVQPFYWEIGDKTGVLAADSTDSATGRASYTATSPMAIASATKWLYAAYVAEKRAGALTASDIKFLHFQSGYSTFDSFDSCTIGQTVDQCLNSGRNGTYIAATDGQFYYGGGHMQKHASLDGLGSMNSAALAAELRSKLGADVALAFASPQLGGGVVTTAADYGRFLRKVLGGQLHMSALLGANSVCTNTASCKTAGATPTPPNERWLYSMGHWVDADAAVGDGAFSSTGAFGFHPWIDASKTTYGVLARRTNAGGAGYDSAECGRLIRKAWLVGTAQ